MVIRQKTLVKLSVTGESIGHGRTDVEVRDLKAIIDEPIERGGTNLGPSPTEYAYTSLMGCTTSISNKCAKKLGIDIGRLSYDMVVEFDRRGVLLMEEVDVPFPSIELNVTSHGTASQEELELVGVETAKYCAVSKLFFAAGTKVEVNWKKA
ncbi:MAG: OsmC family protein [Rhizobiaceae bacterium]